jgi:hypothetical protein
MHVTHSLILIATVSLLYTILVLDYVSTDRANALSPSFARQEIVDANGTDWIISKAGKPEYLLENVSQTIRFPNIISASYSSNGSVLNSTIWLSSEFEKEPKKHAPFYIMYIDVDSDNKTGLTGSDYAIGFSWNETSQAWKKVFLEFSLHGTDKLIWEEETQYTHFSDKDMNSVQFYFDLRHIHHPAQYNLAFSLQDSLNGEAIYDTTSWLPIPPPQFNISASQNSLILRPGEEEKIQLSIDSTTNLQPSIIWEVEDRNDTELNINPKSSSLSSDGRSSSQLHVKILPNATSQATTIPILSHILFPLERANEEGLHIHRYSYLTLDVLPQLNVIDYFNIALNTLGSPLKQLLELLALIFSVVGVGGFTTWKLIKRKQKKKLTKHSKKNKRKTNLNSETSD